MSKLLLVAALASLSAHDAIACTLFEGVYQATSGHTAKAFDDNRGLALELSPGGRRYIENDHCVMPDCLSDSMVTFDEPTDDFANPLDLATTPDDDYFSNPPPMITIKGESYRFYCPSDAPQETM